MADEQQTAGGPGVGVTVETVDATVQAVQAAVRAFVVAGRQLLDTVEAVADDPQRIATAVDAVNGVVAGLMAGLGGTPARDNPRGGRRGFEQIEVDDG